MRALLGPVHHVSASLRFAVEVSQHPTSASFSSIISAVTAWTAAWLTIS